MKQNRRHDVGAPNLAAYTEVSRYVAGQPRPRERFPGVHRLGDVAVLGPEELVSVLVERRRGRGDSLRDLERRTRPIVAFHAAHHDGELSPVGVIGDREHLSQRAPLHRSLHSRNHFGSFAPLAR